MSRLEMKKNTEKGMLITFCGLDGCGKTTMIHRTQQWLKDVGQDLFITKQPTDFVRQSNIFRTYMDQPDHEAYDYRSLSLLAASDRVQHCNKVILPQLKMGKMVLSDRYYYSCLANLRARGYMSDRWIYEVAQSVIKPDLAFFIDVPVETAIGRVRSREEEKNRYIDVGLQYRLREEYLNIAKENYGHVLSSVESEDVLFEKIKQTITHFQEAKNDHRIQSD